MSSRWQITVSIFRSAGGSKGKYDSFTMEVNPDEYVLDVVERIWARHDRSLTFAQACHHSVCGICGMVVNGVEKLSCITPIRSVVENNGSMRLDPLRNFPVVSDLVVDLGSLYTRMEEVGFKQVAPVKDVPADGGISPSGSDTDLERLVDCIECGLCLSACPIVGTSPSYLGPAILAAVQQGGLDDTSDLLPLIDSQDGLWRCHGIHECTEVCPSNVEPAWRIMDLRKQVVSTRIKRIFS